MQCLLCKNNPHPKGNDPRKCAFDGTFQNNWNCGTINLIRELTFEGQPTIPGIEYHFCDEQKYATVRISEVENESGDRFGLALWLTWYKSRGSTEAMWILSDKAPPRLPTEQELLAIHTYYIALPKTN